VIIIKMIFDVGVISKLS